MAGSGAGWAEGLLLASLLRSPKLTYDLYNIILTVLSLLPPCYAPSPGSELCPWDDLLSALAGTVPKILASDGNIATSV